MKKVITVILVCLGLNTFAQPDLDSLYTIWQDDSYTDTVRLNAIYSMSLDLTESDPDSALSLISLLKKFALQSGHDHYVGRSYKNAGYAYESKGMLDLAFGELEHAYDIFYKLNDDEYLAKVLSAMSSVKWTAGEYRESIKFRKRSMSIYNDAGDKEGIASCLQGIAYSYFQMGQYTTAMDRVQQSLKISEEIGDEEGIAWCINAMGVFYSRQGNDDMAIKYFQKALEMNKELDDSLSIAYSLRNIASHYYSLGDKEKTLESYERAYAISEAMNAKRGMALSLSSIGKFYQSEGEPERALSYYKRSLAIAMETGNKNLICEELDDIGRIYLELENAQLSITYCEKSYYIAVEIESVNNQLNACKCLYMANKKLEKHEKALFYHEKMQVLEDSIDVEQLAQDLQQMEFHNQMITDSIISAEEKKSMQIAFDLEVSEKEKSRNIYLAGGLLFLMFTVGLYARNRYVRSAKKKIEIEKERSETLLHNILPEEVATELKEKGESEARDFENVTVLFTDFVGFTQTAQQLSAKELVNELNQCFKAFDEIIQKYHIEKIKTIGDAYMAAGGLHVIRTCEPKDVAQAALEMQAFMLKRKETRSAQNLPAFDMRVGIHTGTVVAGIVGVKKFQYDIWGDTVNTASRMESCGEAGRVNVSQSTYELLKESPQFTFESRGKVEVKGKGDLEMYFVSLR